MTNEKWKSKPYVLGKVALENKNPLDNSRDNLAKEDFWNMVWMD